MKNFFHFLVVIVVIATFFVTAIFAKELPTESSSPSASLNAFELFWPVSPGKTLDEPLYFLKDLKEKIRGALIFGTPQKAEYEVLLGVKRVLETEKLLNQSKNDLANQTLDLAKLQFEMAKKNLEIAKSKKEPLKESGGVTFTRLSNLEKYLNQLIQQHTNNQDKLRVILSQVQDLLAKIK